MTTPAPFSDIVEAQSLPRIVRLHNNLYGAVFTLMKTIPARFILRSALKRGELTPDTVVVETTSGTFGLALAMQCALLGQELILVGDPAIDVHLRRRLSDLGARVEICAKPDVDGGYQAVRLRKVAEIRQSLPRTFCPEQYSNPDNPRSYAIVAEALERTLGTVDCVIGPVGSGGSMCGTVEALRRTRADVYAVGVDTHRSVLFGQQDGPRDLRGLGNSLMPSNLDHRVFDEVHWCGAAETYRATRLLHREHALFQGPTSGAAYLAAKWWAARNRDATCVVMLPDEGVRYQETVYSDEWLAHRGLLTEDLPAEPIALARAGGTTSRWSSLHWGRKTYVDVIGGSTAMEPVA